MILFLEEKKRERRGHITLKYDQELELTTQLFPFNFLLRLKPEPLLLRKETNSYSIRCSC